MHQYLLDLFSLSLVTSILNVGGGGSLEDIEMRTYLLKF